MTVYIGSVSLGYITSTSNIWIDCDDPEVVIYQRHDMMIGIII